MIVWTRGSWDWSWNYRDVSIAHWQRSRYWGQGFLPARFWFFNVRPSSVVWIIVSWKLSLKECLFLDEEARFVCWGKLFKARLHSETLIVGELIVPPISGILM